MSPNEARIAQILLVEDSPADILLTHEIFDESKLLADLTVVQDGQAALDFLRGAGASVVGAAGDRVVGDSAVEVSGIGDRAAGDSVAASNKAGGRHRPDLILLDLNLPKMNGIEVLREIKGDPELRSIPVVMLTTSEDEADVLRSYDLHANSYISKPIDFEGFTRVVRTLEDFWFGVVRLPTRSPGS